jgi:hypothetical protein
MITLRHYVSQKNLTFNSVAQTNCEDQLQELYWSPVQLQYGCGGVVKTLKQRMNAEL